MVFSEEPIQRPCRDQVSYVDSELEEAYQRQNKSFIEETEIYQFVDLKEVCHVRISGFDEPYTTDKRGKRKKKEKEELSDDEIWRKMKENKEMMERVNIDH